MSKTTACTLYEPDGTLLVERADMLPAAQPDATPVLAVRGQPGRLVQRCLLGGLRDVIVRFSEGASVPAKIERVFFDPRLGRACSLRLTAASGPASAP